jgi:Tfp pilus assembly protein PilF
LASCLSRNQPTIFSDEPEKKEQKLDTSQWRVLIDNLAMAYGITGKLTAAEEVLRHGLSKDPTYPMFYFITADLHAERNDFSNTMKNLRLALKYKSNVD